MFTIGQHVMAQWTNGQMYGARIVQTNGALYEVAWDDGSPPLWLESQQIQPDQGAQFFAGGAGQYAPGQHVMAQWTNGQMYGARIVQTNGSLHEVAWDDGSPPLWLEARHIQPDGGGGIPGGFSPERGMPAAGGAAAFGGASGRMAAPQVFDGGGFEMGQSVMARWTNGQMYGARIVASDNGNYEVAWDDGSPNLWVTAGDIMLR